MPLELMEQVILADFTCTLQPTSLSHMTLYAFVLIVWIRTRKLDENNFLPSLDTNDHLPFTLPALNLIGWLLLPWTINPKLKVHLHSHDARPCYEESSLFR